MHLALVVGVTHATVKHDSLNGGKLLIVQPKSADEQTDDGYPLLAVDQLGAGIGQTVMITSDGAGARALLGIDLTPVRWTVAGIRDR